MQSQENSSKDRKLDVKVLLSTYNGERFVKKLLSSLIEQKFDGYKIVIRDDGSSDNTLFILKKFKQEYPQKIELLENDLKVNLGVKKSFEVLMNSAEADIYFFCDQDDVWFPDKIEKFTRIINENIQKFFTVPMIFFSEMTVINDKDVIKHDSFNKLTQINNADLENGIFRGLIPGCSIAFNQPAKAKYFKNENITNLHDVHLFLTVFLTGKIFMIPDSLMFYRVHEKNTVGLGKKTGSIILIKDLIKFLFFDKNYPKIALNEYFETADNFRKDYDTSLCVRKEFFIQDEFEKLGIIKRKIWYFKHFKPFQKGILQGFIDLLLI